MNNNTLYMAIIDKDVSMVEVVFVNEKDTERKGKRYTYKTDLDLEDGDIVVVETYGWYSVAKVVETDVEIPIEDETTQCRWVVEVIEFAEHDRRLKREEELVRGLRKRRTDHMRGQMLAALGLTSEDAKALLHHVEEKAYPSVYDSVIEDNEDDGFTDEENETRVHNDY